jgi:hypothetical protein
MTKFLGTASLVGLVIIGAYALPIWLLIPLIIMNTFIGMHFPAEKAQMAKERGYIYRVLLSSIPLQLAVAAACYGIGRGIGWLLQ